MEIFNHYSFLWGGLIILALAGFSTLRKGLKLNSSLKLIGVALVLVAGWLILRPQAASTSELAQFQGDLGGGKALLLELQSPY